MIPKIEKIVNWYARLPADYRDVNGLMTVRVRLSALLCQFAQDLTALNDQKQRTEFQRKAAYSRAIMHEMSMKSTAAAAKILADNAVLNELESEAVAESEYQKARLLYDAFRNVCDVMSQHISVLRNERSEEMRGKGGQA